jgi:hypothetical protein
MSKQKEMTEISTGFSRRNQEGIQERAMVKKTKTKLNSMV